MERILDVNLGGTARLLEACAGVGFEAFVHAGSSSEYGFKDHSPAEDEIVEPNSVYAVGKAAATDYGRFVARRDGVRVRTLRLYSVFGPWEDPPRLMPRIVSLGRAGTLPPFAAPETARDFVYVDDVCEAFLAAASAAEAPADAVYNIGSGVQTTLRDVAFAARSVFGVEAEPEFGTMASRSWDTSVWVSDPSRAARELDWTARTGVREGLERFSGWLDGAPGAVVERYTG